MAKKIQRFKPGTILQDGAVDRANEVVDATNNVLQLQVKWVKSGSSQIQFPSDDGPAVLTLSLKDINLGSISGSKGSNAALASVINALKAAFTLQDGTT